MSYRPEVANILPDAGGGGEAASGPSNAGANAKIDPNAITMDEGGGGDDDVGDGAAAVVLKRLDDAVRDGDRPYAVIRGMGWAGGGGIETAAPDVRAYEQAVTEALRLITAERAKPGN